MRTEREDIFLEQSAAQIKDNEKWKKTGEE